MLPTFFVIGAAKAGTTSLYSYLSCHPSIHMSPVKEPNFFAEPNRYMYMPRVRSRREYEALFTADAPCRGEASHTYSEYPRYGDVPGRIQAAVPNARLLYLVRDPIDRIQSFYVQALGSIVRRPDSPSVTVAELVGDLDDPTNEFISAGRYMTQVRQYMKVFAPEHLLVLDHADLLSEREATLRRAFAFLGVDPSFSSQEFESEHNSSEEKRYFTDAYVALSKSRAKVVVDRLPQTIRTPLVDSVQRRMSAPVAPDRLDDDLRTQLQEIFAPEVAGLREFTGLPFSSWSI